MAHKSHRDGITLGQLTERFSTKEAACEWFENLRRGTGGNGTRATGT